jgi:ABC-2 type transport system permease protein
MMLVISVVADSFAGERERHTLETLLASRLPDRVILFGKIVTIAAYGWLASIAVLVVGLVVVNLKESGGFVHFTIAATAAGIIAALLTTLIATTVGALVSLRAATVRQAQQLLSVGVIVVALIPGFGVQLLPASWRSDITDALNDVGVTTVVAIGIVVLAAIAAVLLSVAVARFQRGRLLLV